MAMTRFLIALVVGLFVSGCAGVGGIAGLNEKQLKELSKVKDANVLCLEAAATLYGQGTLVVASIDKGIRAVIAVNGHGKCDVQMATETLK